MSERKGKKRPKSYYIKCANKKPKRDSWKLEAGMKGFLVTCNNNEKGAVRDAYNILNEYADKLYGPEKESSGSKEDEDLSEEEEEEDIEKAMKKEVDEIKESKHELRRFQNTNTKAKNLIFIRTTIPDPSQLAHSILSDLWETKVQKSRFAIRLLPIAGTCRAEEGEVKKLGKELFTPIFQTPFGEGYNFSIIVKIRNNNGLGRDSVIPALAGIIKDLNPLHRVNHDKPDFVVLVEVAQSVCCLGIVKDFFKFKKYNLQEVVKTNSENVSIKQGNLSREDSSCAVSSDITPEVDTKSNLSQETTEVEEVKCGETKDAHISVIPDNDIEDGNNLVEGSAKDDLLIPESESEKQANEKDGSTSTCCDKTTGAVLKVNDSTENT